MKIRPEPASGLPGLKALILVTGLGLAMCMGYLLFHRLHDEVTWFPAAAPCDLNTQACTARLGDAGQLTLHIDICGPVSALTPLPLRVDIDGVTSTWVSVDFLSRHRKDEAYRFVLDAVAPGRFRGLGQLGEKRDSRSGIATPWRARVIVDTPEGKLGSWFDFDVRRS
ncbi:hypothetical protein HW452_08660 [Halomonas aquamarina]|uniref:Uncharacterized protein n=1 Tax=Vreelandella aquamarina TaxID=77097 RepID=A0ACC5VUZ5_9GAMM|nr:hypothetical protein [Halomonas aquamarina]MBZ5487596.1 hypothetical protein [Halomonas aquamarina]